MSLLWINGQRIDKSDAKISPFDHGFLYGDGVWEPLRVFNGQVFNPRHHLDLLFAAAETLGIVVPLSRDELLVAIESTVKANNRTERYVRVIITRGPGTLGPDPRKLDPQVIIIAEEYYPFPRDLYSHGLHAVLFPTHIDAENPVHRVRTLGQSHFVLAKQQSLRNGCVEAVFVNRDGKLAGTTEGFLFLVTDGAVVVAAGQPTEATGFAVAALAGDAGLVVVEYAVGRAELLAADEVFIAGTSCGVIGIVRVDGRSIGAGTEGPVTRTVRERFHALTHGG